MPFTDISVEWEHHTGHSVSVCVCLVYTAAVALCSCQDDPKVHNYNNQIVFILCSIHSSYSRFFFFAAWNFKFQIECIMKWVVMAVVFIWFIRFMPICCCCCSILLLSLECFIWIYSTCLIRAQILVAARLECRVARDQRPLLKMLLSTKWTD